MSAIGIFYGTETGRTEFAAKAVRDELGAWRAHLVDVREAGKWEVGRYQDLILGVATGAEGALTREWERFLSRVPNADLTGKRIALFGMGDAERYPDTFVNALGKIADWAASHGAQIIGATDPADRSFRGSDALRDGKLVGLALDEADRTSEIRTRIRDWLKALATEFG